MDCAAFGKPFAQSIHQVYSSPFVKFVIGRRFFDSSDNPRKSRACGNFTFSWWKISSTASGQAKITPRETENQNTKHPTKKWKRN
jgi:hypothetical protein